MSVRIREAVGAEDRRVVLAIAHAANASTEPPGWYASRRLMMRPRWRATWWLLEENTVPVSALLCHRLTLRHQGEPVSGFGLGSVVTHPSARRRGHAARLCQHAAEASGAEVGVLFSSIPPALYRSIGYRVCPALASVCGDTGALASSGPQATLVPLDPVLERAVLQQAFDRQRDGLRSLRDEEGWARSLSDNPSDRFFGVPGGYVRVRDDVSMALVECVTDQVVEVVRAVAALAASLGRVQLDGWLSAPSEVEAHFRPGDRSTTLPMVSSAHAVPTAWLSRADYF